MAPERRFVASMVRGDLVTTRQGYTRGGSKRAENAGFVVLDRAILYRRVGEFASEQTATGIIPDGGGTRRIGIEAARAKAHGLADELNAKHGPL